MAEADIKKVINPTLPQLKTLKPFGQGSKSCFYTTYIGLLMPNLLSR
jgi:hypothetical protein